jgi:ubiquinone/menaquinone biosynthesis C-methylase UbiE/chorismate mutase
LTPFYNVLFFLLDGKLVTGESAVTQKQGPIYVPRKVREIASDIIAIDEDIMGLVLRRMELADQVGLAKYLETDPKEKRIFNQEREAVRLERVGEWAERHGLNKHFACALLYLLIDESCKWQMTRTQDGTYEDLAAALATPERWNAHLKQNLLTLAERWSAVYDTEYAKAFFATQSYLRFESEFANNMLSSLNDRDLLVHLGCATGRFTMTFASTFARIIGIDISQYMITEAEAKLTSSALQQTVSFQCADIEDGLTEIANDSVSCVIMNLGTASDIANAEMLVSEIMRVLKPGGRFMLSFYNKEALLYRWSFFPWETGLAASINIHKRFLEVKVANGDRDEILPVYARAYTRDEIIDLFAPHNTEVEMITFPAVSSVLPRDVLENYPEARSAIESVDRQLLHTNLGAYIIATGTKI